MSKRKSERGFSRALMCGVTLSVLAASGPSMAQQTAAAPKIEEVVVTGSRIPTTNLTSASPVSTTTSAQFELTNSFGLEDILTKMIGPDTTNGTTNNSNNGGVGASQIGLRNLGPSRTLVLVDGQRVVPVFGSTFSVPDLNSVPLAMTERVEVLRDGASSIYGADAIGGVINIITKKDFSGLEFHTDGGLSQHGGGNTHSLSATAGTNFDKGNVTVSILNEKQGKVGQWQRGWASDPHADDPNFPFGSSFRSQLNVLQDTGSKTVWVNGVARQSTDPTLVNDVSCLAYSPVAGRVKLNAGCNTPEGGWNYLTGSVERTQATMSAHYDIIDTVTYILQANFTERKSGQNLRPEPLLNTQIATTDFLSGGIIYPGFMVPANARWGYTGGGVPDTTACGDPNGCIVANLTPNAFGPRAYRQTSDTYRVRTGFEGIILDKYKWEAGFVGQRNNTTQLIYNSGNWNHLAQMTGLIPCVDVPGGCSALAGYNYLVPTTPVNFFNGPNNISAVQRAYLTYTNNDKNESDQNYFYVDANGPLFSLPAGEVKVAIGYEHRTEHLSQKPDTLEVLGYAANHVGPTSGGYRTDAEYAELQIPLLADKPFAKSVDLNPSVRHDKNSVFGSDTTYKIGGNYEVDNQVRFRGSYATGFRAPSVSELYNAQAVSFISVSGDPCDSRGVINGNTNMGQASLAAGSTCYQSLTALGLTPAQIAAYQSPENNLSKDQRGFIIGGSPTVKPEKSKQWSVGGVLTPNFVPGLSFAADYYQIRINNSIVDGGIALIGSPDFVPLGCYVQQKQDFCALITRNASGIFQVSSANTNSGQARVRGLDMELSYANEFKDIGINLPGAFTIDVKAVHQFTNTQTNPDGTVTQFNGFFNLGNESIQPKWKGTLNVDYALDGLRLHWDTSYIQGTEDLGGVNHVYGDYIPDVFYHNISASYELADLLSKHTDLFKKAQIVIGVNNLMDKDPPFLGGDSICKCNSFAGPYDFVGRFFYTRLTFKM